MTIPARSDSVSPLRRVGPGSSDLTGPADLRDQRWLDQQVATLGDGIEAAREIWLNWSDLRCVGRLHPGMTAGDFLASQLGGLRLDVGDLVKALPDMSGREIAKVAGVDRRTVDRARGANVPPDPDEPPARVVGADGKSYPGRVIREVVAEVIEPQPEMEEAPTDSTLWTNLVGLMETIEILSATKAVEIADNVPTRRRAATARRLRKLGTYLGSIAWSLEGKEPSRRDNATSS